MVEEREAKEIMKMAQCLYNKNLISPLRGGAISIRVGSLFLITNDDFSPLSISFKDLSLIDISSLEVIAGLSRPNKEYKVHALVYQNRSDVNSIIFGNPLYTTLFSASKEDIRSNIFAQGTELIKNIKKVSYATNSFVFAERVAEELYSTSVCLVENFGAFVAAYNINEASAILETLEKSAHMSAYILDVRLNNLNPLMGGGISYNDKVYAL